MRLSKASRFKEAPSGASARKSSCESRVALMILITSPSHSGDNQVTRRRNRSVERDSIVKKFGELGGIRTLDLQIKSPLLYQLSYELP
jgi:hypothetical protein